MNLKGLWRPLTRVIVSLICGGIAYFVWMSAFLLTLRFDRGILDSALWMLAPVVTAAGFAAGVLLVYRLTGTRLPGVLAVFVWPLAGCSMGAAVVYWFGPMLIVFGMLVAGTASVAMREVLEVRRYSPS